MTDPKNKGTGDDLDWDSALDEWDKAFEPDHAEVAEDKDTKKPATLTGAPGERLSRPLYRPPTPPPSGAVPPSKPPPLPRPAPPQRPAPPKVPAGKPRRTGLGQLFGRAEPRPHDDVDVLLRNPSTEDNDKTEIHDQLPPLPELPELDVVPPPRAQVTSAMDLEPGDVELVDAAEAQGAALPQDAGPPSVTRPLQITSSGDEETAQIRSDQQDGVARAREGTATFAAPPRSPLPVLAPEERMHDPDAETSVMSGDAEVEPREDVAPASRTAVGYASEDATEIYVPLPPMRPLTPSRAWISDEDGREGHAARASWMEAEVRATEDPSARARGLLAVSELRALLGEGEAAARLAIEARDLVPGLPLAHRQARGLAASMPNPQALLEALDREAAAPRSPAARVHATLLAADLLRVSGDDDGAAQRLAQAAATEHTDARVAVARIAQALAKGDREAALRLKEEMPPGAIATALGALLRARGWGDFDVQGPMAANDALRRAREALDAGNIPASVLAVAELAAVPELSAGARWLSAMLASTRAETRASALTYLRGLVEDGEELARRPLAACAVQLGDAPALRTALTGEGFSVADRAVLATLLDLPAEDLEPHAAALAETEVMASLSSAIAGARPLASGDGEERANAVIARASRVAGSASARSAQRIARLLGDDAPPSAVEEALPTGEDASLEIGAVRLELAVRAGRAGDVSDALRAWPAPPGGDPSDPAVAAGLVAERSSDPARALAAYREARKALPSSEALLRAVASLDRTLELPQELNDLADALGEGARGALARLEAVIREQAVDDPTRLELVERAHRAAPELPIAGFLAERLARRSGDVDEVLRWIRERRAGATDPLEQALDAVREALLIADTEPALATERLLEAHKTRPNDVALRELYERLAREPPPDRGAWREQRAAISVGDAKALYYMEAAHEYERAGDHTGALRAAEAAVASVDTVLTRLSRARAEVEGGQPARLADELLSLARGTEDARERREAYERLADLDATGRADPASALLWHRTILEETPEHKPSLRHIEHALISEGRDDELEPIMSAIARALTGAAEGEGVAHAEFAARLRARGAAGDWGSTRELAELAVAQPEPSLGALRLLNAHARVEKDDATILSTGLALVLRTTRPPEIAALLVRAAEAATRLGSLDQARELLERARTEDPGDVVTWTLLADMRRRGNDPQGSAEACESVARTSRVPAHQVGAWHAAAHLWMDEVHDENRAVAAFEQAATIDVAYLDVFPKLSALYTTRGARGELASLLERRIAGIHDPAERVTMEVERGQALIEVGELAGARTALEAALETSPDHTTALAAFADLCSKVSDWEGAEQAWVRLARLLTSTDEQRAVYARLGELYSVHAVNLSRAELAFREVHKRAPNDIATLERLVDVYKRMNDAGHAVEIAQQLVTLTKDPAGRRQRLVELAQIHEAPGRDLRKAEQVLESARREAPTDVRVMRALAEFYIRHKQMPAVQILLDRAAADARRAFAAGRFAPELFEVMRTVFELRGKKDASLVVAGTLAALDGQPAVIRGGDARALDPRLDDLLAPEALSAPFRALLAKCGGALDTAAPYDARASHATPLTSGPVHQFVGVLASAIGIHPPQLMKAPHIGNAVIPASSSPPTLVLGDGLLVTTNDRARTFLIVRALKLVLVQSSALVRIPATELVVLVSAWLQALNPSWTPQGVNPVQLKDAAKRLAGGLPRRIEQDVGTLALEVAGALGPQIGTLGASALAWANRAALLAVGDANAALDAIAFSYGKDGAPTNPKERTSWVVRTREASDLLAYSVSDAYAEARTRLGVDR